MEKIAKKEAEANLKQKISFKGAQIPQFEADILKEIELPAIVSYKQVLIAVRIDIRQCGPNGNFEAVGHKVAGVEAKAGALRRSGISK